MSIPAYKEKRYTYKDYLEISDDNRYEIIEGGLMMVPAPIPFHQKISKKIEFEFVKFVEGKKLGEVFDAPCDVILDEENVVQPDIMVILNKNLNIIKEKNISGVPDLIVEILSESTAYIDLIKKKKLYERFQVKEYWIVDPAEKTITVYSLKKNKFIEIKTFSQDETLSSPLFSGFSLSVSDMF